MKKIVALFLVIVMILPLSSCDSIDKPTGKQNDEIPAKCLFVGDANNDGKVDEADITRLEEYLADGSGSVEYEFCDLNSDYKLDENDLELLKKLVENGEKSSMIPFGKEDADVTNELEYLGLNKSHNWNETDYKYIVSRNPIDMISSNGIVFVSGGNYNDNTGPVDILGFTRNSDKSASFGSAQTEQINEFYKFGDYVVGLAVDPREWGYGEYYILKDGDKAFRTEKRAFKDCIHVYDMVEYHGMYFFAGSNVGYDKNIKNKNVNGSITQVEMSKASIFVLKHDIGANYNETNYKEVKLVTKDAEFIDYKSNLVTIDDPQYPGLNYYYTSGVPRIYNLFVYNDTLYALYNNQYTWSKYKGMNDYNGLYKYNEEKGWFVYDKTVDYSLFEQLYATTKQDLEKITHDFEWKGNFYFIASGLYTTGDFVNYKEIKLPKYEDYTVTDAIMRGDTVYLLANVQNKDKSYTNIVVETEDFKNFRTILHFNSTLFARSFEFCNGDFYFGLGFTPKYNNSSPVLPEHGEDCGKIYRYRYYQ